MARRPGGLGSDEHVWKRLKRNCHSCGASVLRTVQKEYREGRFVFWAKQARNTCVRATAKGIVRSNPDVRPAGQDVGLPRRRPWHP